MFADPVIWTSCLTCSVVFLYLASRWFSRKRNPLGFPLPPGPKPLPIIGNLHQAPKEYDWLRYTEWGDKYGEIIFFRLLGQDVLLLNTRKAAFDLLEKRSNIYSDRPRTFIMAGELLGWNRGVAMSPMGPRHRQFRRILGKTLNPTAARRLWTIQENGVQKYLRRVALDPENFHKHIFASTSETMVMISFGQECSKDEFPYIEMAERIHAHFARAAAPYANPIDIFPALRYFPEWLPGMQFKKLARTWKKELETVVRFPLRLVKADLENSRAHPSYLASLIDTEKSLSLEDEEIILWSAASLYTAGVDTSAASVNVFILAMCLHPDVQIKAQKELDDVIGQNRLPTFTDRDQLPYLDACLKEVLRWYPIVPLGLAHRVMQTDYYEGYYIPEGTTVIPNLWHEHWSRAMSRDSTMYSRPDEFIPERFLPAVGYVVPEPLNAFGFGRRIYPGLHLADSSLFLHMARILVTFNVTKVKDAHGNEVAPNVEFASGLISQPKPFMCTIAARSDRALRLVGMK